MIRRSLNGLVKLSGVNSVSSANTFGASKYLNLYNPHYYFAKMLIALESTVKVPSMGDSITEGTVLEIKKKVGEAVKRDEPVIILETDKVQVEVKAPEAGVVTQVFAQLQAAIGVGAPAFEIDSDGKATATTTTTEAPKKEAEAPKKDAPKEAAAPKVEAKKEEAKPAPKTETKTSSAPAQVFGGNRAERREPMSKMRQVIAKRLKESQNVNAMLTTFQEVDMSSVMDCRKELADEFAKKHGIKLGFMSFFIRAATLALKDQPIVNSVIDNTGKEVIHRNYIDISVAVATPSGLLVPVIRNCESLSFANIEKVLADLGARGKDNKITPEELSGGTFTISNGGVFGSLMGTPIINLPQSAILGMHAVVNRPVVVKDQIVARPMMYLALTYDHRIIDGREAVTFLKKIRTHIEDPRRMLLEL